MADDSQLVPLFGEVLVQDLAKSGPAPTLIDRKRLWLDAIDLWLSSRPAENTRRAYRKAWEIFLAFSGKDPWEVGKADVQRWTEAMKKQGLSACTIGQRVAALSSFYSYAMDEYTTVTPDGRELPLHEHNPAAAKSLRPKVSPYDKAIHLSPEETRALLAAIRPTTVQGLRDRALFLTYLFTGRRNTEARSLKWGDIEENGERVWYRWSGKRKSGRNELPSPVWRAIRAYLAAAGRLEGMRDEDYIFTAISDRARRLKNVSASWKPTAQPLSMREVGALLKKYARRAGLDARKIHVHTLRHTAAMLRKEAGDNVEEIQRFLEHSSLAITQIYLHRVEGKTDTSWAKVEALLGL